jgi:hypothetical protein
LTLKLADLTLQLLGLTLQLVDLGLCGAELSCELICPLVFNACPGGGRDGGQSDEDEGNYPRHCLTGGACCFGCHGFPSSFC